MHHHRTAATGTKGERGASAIEYALLLALIAIVCFSAVSFFGASSSGGLGKSRSCINAAYNGDPLPSNCPP